MTDPTSPEPSSAARIGFDFAALVRDARAGRLGVGLCIVGCVHLAIFVACHFLYVRGDRAAIHYLPLWAIDVGCAGAVLIPRLAGLNARDGARSSWVVVRIWLTFAILCLTSASMNSITGFEVDWFKISWAMLGTFGFAMLAWVFHLAFLLPAVFMSLTALLIAAHPGQSYLIFGLSWFATLQALGLMLEVGPLWQRVTHRDCVVFRQANREF